MELYWVNNQIGAGFNREIVIDEYISAIWTERFTEASDVQLVMPAVHEHLRLLAPGNLLGCQGSQEIMLMETRSIQDGLVTAKGKAVETFFNERVVEEIVMSSPGGDLVKGVVNYMLSTNIEGISMDIPGLRENPFSDPNEPEQVWTETIPAGPVYDTILNLAKKYNLGMAVFWTKIGGGDHELLFDTWYGKNLDIQFSPKLDNFANTKQLLSISGYKNAVLAKPPTWANPDTVFYASNLSDFDNSVFRDRYILIDGNDITQDSLTGTDVEKMEKVAWEMDSRQRKAFREHKRTKIVDGEITPDSRYVYKRDFNLGDSVLVAADFGDPVRGIITEYIRSVDESGARSYPTVSSPVEQVAQEAT